MPNIDFTYATDVLNPEGKVQLVTSLELFVRVPDASGTYYSTPVGMAQDFNVDETRNVVYNFVIGNRNPSRARDLIPGPVTTSTIRLKMVSLYVMNGIGLFTTPNPAAMAFAPALPQNTRPFDLVERWINPSTGHTLYEILYTGCFINHCSSPKAMNGSDIRVIHDMSVTFKDILYVPSSDLQSDIAGGTLGNPFEVK